MDRKKCPRMGACRPLPYGYATLEPSIDARTMMLHHDKHHASYVEKLNAALEKFPELQHVVRDVTRLAAVGTQNLVTVGVERVVPVRVPIPCHRVAVRRLTMIHGICPYYHLAHR